MNFLRLFVFTVCVSICFVQLSFVVAADTIQQMQDIVPALTTSILAIIAAIGTIIQEVRYWIDKVKKR